MRFTTILLVPTILISATIGSFGQDKSILEAAMNESSLCSALKINTSTIQNLIPYKIPNAIPNTDIGVDKNAHRVSEFQITADTAKISGEFGCQPSGEGVPFKFPFNENPNKWRISDNFSCVAEMSDNVASNVSCSTSGTVGSLIANVTNVDDQMKNIVNIALK